ncbi:MAG: amidohydrolase family protein [Proteobacteria bacterium]|nr:amidohydrolase family protein [Pseudomonadota bacterium]
MPQKSVDTLVVGATIVTMDAERSVIQDGALAMDGNQIVALGPRAEVEQAFMATTIVDGRRFVITPGMVNGHIHITGDPLTQAYMPDDLDGEFNYKLQRFVLPRYQAHTPADERLSAQMAALRMLRTGTTCFIEAGTVQYLDDVVDGLNSLGIRGRVSNWIEGRTYNLADDQVKIADAAIKLMEDGVARYPAANGERIAGWPILVGHSTNPDEVWRAAKALADANGLGISAHMSPRKADPDWFLANTGKRPLEHLGSLGVLGPNVSITHLAQIDDSEFDVLVDTGTNAICCPLAAMRAAQGIITKGYFPKMSKAGVRIMLGSDGYDCDLLRQGALFSSAFRDAYEDVSLFSSLEIMSMLTDRAAAAMGLSDEIGSLEVGKKADFVCHDIDRPEWMPLLDPMNLLVWSGDGRSVHSVWVDGQRVIEDYRSTLVDENELYATAQMAGERIIEASNLPDM